MYKPYLFHYKQSVVISRPQSIHLGWTTSPPIIPMMSVHACRPASFHVVHSCLLLCIIKASTPWSWKRGITSAGQFAALDCLSDSLTDAGLSRLSGAPPLPEQLLPPPQQRCFPGGNSSITTGCLSGTGLMTGASLLT